MINLERDTINTMIVITFICVVIFSTICAVIYYKYFSTESKKNAFISRAIDSASTKLEEVILDALAKVGNKVENELKPKKTQ